jgi:hypothetical protein
MTLMISVIILGLARFLLVFWNKAGHVPLNQNAFQALQYHDPSLSYFRKRHNTA